MKGLTIITFLFLSLFTQAQTYSSVVSDKDIYQFINWHLRSQRTFPKKSFLKRKAISHKITPWYKGGLEEILSSEKEFILGYNFDPSQIFNEHDSLFMLQQFAGIKDSIWQRKFNFSYLVNKSKTQVRYLYDYKLPLFSVDGQYVLIQSGFYCGSLCGQWDLCIYKKVGKRKWKLFEEIYSMAI